MKNLGYWNDTRKGPQNLLENNIEVILCHNVKMMHKQQYVPIGQCILLFPFRISGWGYEIGPVCLSVCVCLSVGQRSSGLTDWATDLKSCIGIDLDNISDEFEGKGHRSKIKVTMLKNVIFRTYLWCVLCILHRAILSWHMMLRNDFQARILTRSARWEM